MTPYAWQILVVVLSACVFASRSDTNFGLNALNQTLNGRIRQVEPLALPCFSSFEGSPVQRHDALCAQRQANYTNPQYRREQPGGYMYDTWTASASDPDSRDQCLLDPANPTNPAAWEKRDCRLGNLPTWYIAIRSASDAATVFRYAERFNMTLSIKNSGHTYLDDAGSAGSLLLWTRKLQKLRHHTNFVPKGCHREATTTTATADGGVHAITTGAGIGCGEAYEFAERNNATILCGYSPTVGLSGGWVMGGGHSVLSNVYGTGVDRVLQFKIVTPDGRLRTANKCQHPDLFWALRGGGGGTYGLVLESTHLVEPRLSMAVATVQLPSPDNRLLIAKFMDLLVDTAIDLAEDGWGGHIYGTRLVYVNPLITNVGKARRSLDRFVNFIASINGTFDVVISSSWYKFFQDFVLTGQYAVGNLQLIGTQLAPIDLFTSSDKRSQLKRLFHDELQRGNLPYVPVDFPYLARKKRRANDTSVLPAWYDALWEIGVGGQFLWNSTLKERQAVVTELQLGSRRVAKLTGGYAYKNEANPFTPNWREAWYGAHYDALARIKEQYDPHRVLNCWGCVGWTERDALTSNYAAFTNMTA